MPTQDHICEISDVLVNSCRSWLGARAAGYPQVPTDFHSQHEFHEHRIGRNLDLVHAFATPRQMPLTDGKVRAWANRVETYLVHNWKPAKLWTDAAGGNPKIDAHIDRAALKFGQLAPKQVFVILHHEPENDSFRAHGRHQAGSAADYRAMWANVRSRFDRLGVDNIIWGMAYMNYPKWSGVLEELWPGDDLVDWLWFNAYGSQARPNIDVNIAEFLAKVDALGIGKGKPRGIAEWGISGVEDHVAIKYYEDAVRLLDGEGVIPSPDLKAWMVFDSPGTHADSGLRLGFDDSGLEFREKHAAYNRFTQHPAFTCPHSGLPGAVGGVMPTPAWLANVELHEFTAAIPRIRAENAPAGLCGALPAVAFDDVYCLRNHGHAGDHSSVASTARRMDATEARSAHRAMV